MMVRAEPSHRRSHFHYAPRFATGALARILDSLVRVSRRDKRKNFVSERLRRGLNPGGCPKTYRPRTTPTPQRTLTYARAQVRRPKARRKMREHQHFCRLVPSYQFQALFNSLFKVLCIFPSRYLFAIGLPPIFSLRWNLPPVWSAIPSKPTRRRQTVRLNPRHRRDCHPLRCPVPRDFSPGRAWSCLCRLQPDRRGGQFTIWAGPASLAVTEGILVSFFSSA